jgi:hypothetical protein
MTTVTKLRSYPVSTDTEFHIRLWLIRAGLYEPEAMKLCLID